MYNYICIKSILIEKIGHNVKNICVLYAVSICLNRKFK